METTSKGFASASYSSYSRSSSSSTSPKRSSNSEEKTDSNVKKTRIGQFNSKTFYDLFKKEVNESSFFSYYLTHQFSLESNENVTFTEACKDALKYPGGPSDRVLKKMNICIDEYRNLQDPVAQAKRTKAYQDGYIEAFNKMPGFQRYCRERESRD